jgi:hypothetical protein
MSARSGADIKIPSALAGRTGPIHIEHKKSSANADRKANNGHCFIVISSLGLFGEKHTIIYLSTSIMNI